MTSDPFNTRRSFAVAGDSCAYQSLPALAEMGLGEIARLPVSIRVLLESVLRNCGGKGITEEHVRQLAKWRPRAERTEEIPFVVARILAQDFTGVPLLADLAAMRDAAEGGEVSPQVPVHLVIDHSVQVDYFNTSDALVRNMRREFERNLERYRFLKWGMSAFDNFEVVPPGIGIVHQVNLEYLAPLVIERGGICYPDSLVGTDSHTTMINGLGVVGWGVGGIEAEAAMLGLPIYLLTPDVVGVNLKGSLGAGVTATDLVLTLTEMLRREKVVGKFVEFYGKGAASLHVTDRATVANMAPEYGATLGFFPVDEHSCKYMLATGRDPRLVERVRAYYRAQGMFGMPLAGQCDYSQELELDLSQVKSSIAGPKRPQDRIELGQVPSEFHRLLRAPVAEGGYGIEGPARRAPALGRDFDVGDGDVLIAAITSCTNTSNPSVMIAAGLVAQKAVARGLKVHGRIKTSLAPGSRVVTDYLEEANLMEPLEALGYHIVGYGCTTCIGNSGPLVPGVEESLSESGAIGVSVLSGNRNFEARVHRALKANFLMSPPLVIAYGLAGRIDIDFDREPLGEDTEGKPVYLRELWPASEEVKEFLHYAMNPDRYRQRYGEMGCDLPLWNEVSATDEKRFNWGSESTYIRRPPFFEDPAVAGLPTEITEAYALAIFGDSVTTDHISPAGNIEEASPAGIYLREHGIPPADFNSYGARRGNHEVMMRGTFANIRIRNLMVPGSEGGITRHVPSGEDMPIYDAAMRYRDEGRALFVFAGREYGSGSSRDWAAKGSQLLGVRAVIAASFERIHRSNLVGMGVLPCQFREGEGVAELALDGSETFALELGQLRPLQDATLRIRRADGSESATEVRVRIDTAIEIKYFRAGGILPYVLQGLSAQAA